VSTCASPGSWSQRTRGYAPDLTTIATALRDRLDRTAAVNALCHNQEIHNRRN
jgi:hypothetical protein